MSQQEEIRALLVEDDDEDALIFCRHAERLTSHKMTVVRAASAEEAWRAIAADRFDLIFLDLTLGRGVTGIGLLGGFQASNVDVPVIVVTGSGDEAKAVEAMKAGAYDYLCKDDLTVNLLERAIRYARRRRFLEQDRARMIQKLAELSVTDELTGLANRRHLIQRLSDEAKRSARTERPFALLMIDLDHFKRVNDRYGHQTGDEVLKQCAGALKANLRSTDFAARYGGEEFCVVLPETPLPGAREVAEKVRCAVAELAGPVPTVSVGVAVWAPTDSADNVLRKADRALYQAKEAGRDRVAVGESNGRLTRVGTGANGTRQAR